MKPWSIVQDFERALCEYTGAPYAVAVNGCTMALFLSLMACEARNRFVTIPRRTYRSVPMMIKHAGASLRFHDEPWRGSYRLRPFEIWDSARRFTSGMFDGGFHCVSFHPTKILGLSHGGGAILHDCRSVDHWLRKARFHGRDDNVKSTDGTDMTFCGWEARMWPATAAEGLQRLAALPHTNADLPNDDYPDLSTMEIFK